MKVLAENKRARFDYQILETFEAGIVLNGQEVKAAKEGKASLKGAFLVFKGEEPYLINANIPPYQPKNAPPDYDPERARKVLLKKREIKYLLGKSKEKGLTLIPLRLYTKARKGDKESNKRKILIWNCLGFRILDLEFLNSWG